MRRAAPIVLALGCIASAAGAQSSARSVVLTAAGDLVPNALAMASIRRASTETEGYAQFLAGYVDVLASAPPNAIDYLNLEVPLVDDVVPLDGGWPASLPEHPRRAPVLGASPALASVLAASGVDVVGLANNHAYDQGCAGLRRTRDAATSAGLAMVGAGEDARAALGPLIVERAGARVAFVSFSTSFNRTAHDEPRMYAGHDEPFGDIEHALAEARTHADIAVALVHWGRDFQTEPDGEMRSIAARLVAAGADVVLGTGPHVLHRVERTSSPRGEALIAYSLGNVASGMGRAYRVGHRPHSYVHPANALPEGRDGLVLVVRASRTGDRVSIDEVRGIPLWMENDYVDHPDTPTIRSARLASTDHATCAERLPIIRTAIGSAVTIDDACP